MIVVSINCNNLCGWENCLICFVTQLKLMEGRDETCMPLILKGKKR